MLISAGVVLAVIGRVLYKYGKDKRTAALPVGRITEAERINRLLSRLEELRNRGIISDAEFAQKQQELLARGSRGR